MVVTNSCTGQFIIRLAPAGQSMGHRFLIVFTCVPVLKELWHHFRLCEQIDTEDESDEEFCDWVHLDGTQAEGFYECKLTSLVAMSGLLK